MEANFWHKKWQKDELGFHQSEANPLLIQYFSRLKTQENSCIFIPLCGKTLDIQWLLQRGYKIIGVELSQIAVDALFDSLSLSPVITQTGKFKQYTAENITLFCGDLFDLNTKLIGSIDAIYDRAALIALPIEMRKHYTKHLHYLTRGAPQLLICFDYDQTQLAGPPFCVNAEEINMHYGDHFNLDCLSSEALPGGLKDQCAAQQEVWLLTPRHSKYTSLTLFSPVVIGLCNNCKL